MNTACMTENDYLSDLLSTQKQLMRGYSVAIMESSCPNMRQVMTTQFEQAAQDQYKVFDAMATRGLYPTPAAPDNLVTQAQQKFSQAKTMMN